jgi:hypothetical protein
MKITNINQICENNKETGFSKNQKGTGSADPPARPSSRASSRNGAAQLEWRDPLGLPPPRAL